VQGRRKEKRGNASRLPGNAARAMTGVFYSVAPELTWKNDDPNITPDENDEGQH
jgi:hypothetical protein